MKLPEIIKVLDLLKEKTESIDCNLNNEVVIRCNKSHLASVLSFLVGQLHCSLVMVAASDERGKKESFKIRYFFSYPAIDLLLIVTTDLNNDFPSHSSTIPALNWYEREVRDMFGLRPVGHPDLRPLILYPENFPPNTHPLNKDFSWNQKLEIKNYGSYEYKPVEGEGVFNILVGPIHAGIIEPGHFRFSMAGEPILRLEIRHFWKHRGLEKLGEGKEPKDLLRFTDKISGDHSFAHTLAYVQAVEKMSGTEIPERAKFIRVVFAELERLMCNLNDFAWIFQDVGYSFGAQGVFVLKEDVMRLNKQLSGSRFNKGMLIIGGINNDLGKAEIELLKAELNKIREGYLKYKKLLFNSPTVLERVEGTGVIKYETVKDLSCVGYTARASGLQADIRKAHPYLVYQKLDFKSAILSAGDVFARLKIRLSDMEDSFSIIEQCIAELPGGEAFVKPNPVPEEKWALGYAEGQRGSIFHFVMTDKDGRISRWKVRDPSFANWQAIQFAVLGDIIGDFPLVNKSLNLSYAGNDL